MISSRYFLIIAFVVFAFSMCAPDHANGQDRISTAESRQLKRIQASIKRAGKLYDNKKYPQSAKLVTELAGDLNKMLQNKPSPALLAAAQPVHQQLTQAREALATAGQSIAPIVALPEPGTDPNAPVSFTREVAIILNRNCGGCHVQRTQGQFSMATYNALANGVGGAPVVVPGKSDESRLIEAIEEGSMPPNGNGIPDAQMERLKKWINDGASFDGQDREAPVAQMARATRPALQVSRPLGNETVSFATDVAPVLMANCGGCHFEAQNTRGGLRVDSFRQLLRGGDSGSMLKPGDGANSLLIKRLTANDNTRMPQRRPALDKEVIDKIVTWIDEGARFDGRTAQMNLRQVNAIAVSERATHDELMVSRQERVMRDWKKVMSDVQPVSTNAREVFVVSTEDSKLREAIADFSDQVSQEIKNSLNIDDKLPLVKGQVSVFVFDRRYDYSEFGRMIETRDLPKAWLSHWGYDTVTAYVAALATEGKQLSSLKPDLTQRLAAVAAASLGSDVPEWFADGLGYVVAADIVSDSDAVAKWQAESNSAVSSMTTATDFMQGRLANDQSGLVAYAFVKALRDADKSEFQKFLEAVKAGVAFNEAFAATWSAPPIELIRRQFGGGARQRNNRQRRQR